MVKVPTLHEHVLVPASLLYVCYALMCFSRRAQGVYRYYCSSLCRLLIGVWSLMIAVSVLNARF